MLDIVTVTRIPFMMRGTSGVIAVDVSANVNPVALGCDLLSDELPADAASGFPVCRASADIELDGYAAAFGWIQLVRSMDSSGDPTAFEIDPLALFRGVSNPYAFFGIRPRLFDAPFRESRSDLEWEAHSFLCFTPDAVMSREVAAAAGFSWGFSVSDSAITIADVAELGAEAWNNHLAVLTAAYPQRRFDLGFRA